jgi:hypothetical protein
MRIIPAATQRFDQPDTCRHLFHPEIQRRPLIVQQSGLRGDYIEVNVQAGLVTGVGEGQVALRRFDGGILLLKFLGQDSQR